MLKCPPWIAAISVRLASPLRVPVSSGAIAASLGRLRQFVMLLARKGRENEKDVEGGFSAYRCSSPNGS